MKTTREKLKQRVNRRQQAHSVKAEEWESKICSKRAELIGLIKTAQSLMVTVKKDLKDFKESPPLIGYSRQCVTLAQELIALLKQAEAEGFKHITHQDSIELCNHAISVNSLLIGEEALDLEAMRELKRSNPQQALSMRILGRHHFKKKEFKLASSYFRKSQFPIDQFYYFYSEAHYHQGLNPVNIELVEENYRTAEKMYGTKSETCKDLIDAFYCDWAEFYISVKRKNDAKNPLEKGAKLGCARSQGLYAAYLMEQKDPKLVEGLKWRQQAARQGDVESQVSMALMSLRLIRSTPEASKNEQKEAAKQFNILMELSKRSLWAKMEMANCMAIGKGVEQNIPKAIEILQDITENKEEKIRSDAQFYLGQLFCQTGNVEAGIRLLQAAASQEHLAAQINLALLHEIGWGVEVNPETARYLLKKAAQVSRFGYSCWQAFLKRRVETGAISQARYEKESKELSSEALPVFDRFIPVFNPGKHGGDPSHFTTKSYDDGINNLYYSQLNLMIDSIVKSPNLYINDRIRALFFNITMAETLDSANLVKAIFNIGILFAKISQASCDTISQYTMQISALVARLSAKAPTLTAQEIALALDGVSKLQLNPEQDALQHNIILLLDYAKKNIKDFKPKDLSMAVSGLIRLGLSWSVFSMHLKLFLQHIQDRWKQFEPVTLMHFAYMFAILDVDQPDNQPRLIRLNLLEQLFKNIETHLDSLEMDSHAASQLDLALRYFSKRYEKNKSTLPSLDKVLEGFKKKGEIMIPPSRISSFEHQVCLFIVKKVGRTALEPQAEINGLKVDALINKKLVLQVQGPSHYKYLLGKSITDEKDGPVPTAKDKFHDTLCKQAGYSVKHMPFFIWQNLPTDKEKTEYLCKEGIVSTMP